ncbi:hypothetical protein D3C71_1972570 [compost metagenome]
MKKKQKELDVAVAVVLKHIKLLTDDELEALNFITDLEIKERDVEWNSFVEGK